MIERQPGEYTAKAKPASHSVTPVLPCVDRQEFTAQGRIYPMKHLSWHMLPLCSKDITEPGLASEEEPFAHSGDLQQRITSKLAAIQHFQRRSRHLAHAYLHLRRQHVRSKAGRALRIGLNRASRRLAQMGEEVLR